MKGKQLRFYAGIIVNPWTGKDVDGLHKPMITKEEMYQIMLIRSGKAKAVKRNKYNPDFPLRRTVMCATCSRPLTASAPRGDGGRYFYYHCQNKQCPMFGKGIHKLDLEREFLVYLEQITPKEKFLVMFKDTILNLWKEKGRNFELEAEKWSAQLRVLEGKKKRIYEMREDGSYIKEEFTERKEEIENEIAAVKISLSEARIEQFDIEGTLIYATSFIRNLGRQWFDLAPHLQPKFQKLIFPEGIPYRRNEGFGTAKLGYIYELNQRFKDDKSRLVDYARISWNYIIKELRAWQELQTEMVTAF